MNQEERDNIWDVAFPTDFWKENPIWDDDEEIQGEWAKQWTLDKWFETLDHPRAHPGCCKTCGCATSCMLGVYHDAVVGTVLRRLDELGLLNKVDKE